MQPLSKLYKSPTCHHGIKPQPEGLALITIGNSQREDDGIAEALCDALPESALKGVCRFDLGSFTGYLGDCLCAHKAAIIIDSTNNGTGSGTVSIVNLGAVLDQASPMKIQSCHGFSLADELRLAKKFKNLPKRIIFFGIENSRTSWKNKLSSDLQARLPHIVEKLSLLVSTVLETLKRDA